MNTLFTTLSALVLCVAYVTCILDTSKNDNYNITLWELKEYSYAYVKITEPTSIHDCSGICQLIEFHSCGNEKPKFSLKEKGIRLDFIDLPTSREFRVIQAKPGSKLNYEFLNTDFCYCQRYANKKLEYNARVQDYINLLNDTLSQLEKLLENTEEKTQAEKQGLRSMYANVAKGRQLVKDLVIFGKTSTNDSRFDFGHRANEVFSGLGVPFSLIDNAIEKHIESLNARIFELEEKKRNLYEPGSFHAKYDIEINSKNAALDEYESFLESFVDLQMKIKELQKFQFLYANTLEKNHYSCRHTASSIDERDLNLKNIRYNSYWRKVLEKMKQEASFFSVREVGRGAPAPCVRKCDYFSLDHYNRSENLDAFFSLIRPTVYESNVIVKDRLLYTISQSDKSEFWNVPLELVGCFCKRRDFQNAPENFFAPKLASFYKNHILRLTNAIALLKSKLDKDEPNVNFTFDGKMVTISRMNCKYMKMHLERHYRLLEVVEFAVRVASLENVLDAFQMLEIFYGKKKILKIEPDTLKDYSGLARLKLYRRISDYNIKDLFRDYKEIMQKSMKTQKVLLLFTKRFSKETPFHDLTLSSLFEISKE